MGTLHYTAIASLDGYVADERGNFDWAAPDEQVHAFVNDLERQVGIYLLGRRMYEVMAYWDTAPLDADKPAVALDYASIWRAIDKVVYSTTLDEPSAARTRLERTFDADAVRRMKASSATGISVGGPELAGHAFEAGLVDECHIFVNPVVVGSGTACFPGHLRIELELLDERRFDNGVVHLHYRVSNEEERGHATAG